MAFNREKALTAAAKFVSKGQHDRAAREYVAIIEADPNDTRSWLLLAEALTNAGDKPGAIERYLHVAEGYAGSAEAQKAIAVYRKVLALDPNRLDIQTRIAALYKDLGRTADAVAAYEFVAQAYFQAGQIAEGLEGFRMVAELEPAAVGKRLRLAELYSREGMVAQAVEHFRLAADRLLADRRTDDYIRVAERLIYHKEDDLPVLRSLAQIYLKQGENRRALVKLNALLRAAPADAEGLELLGETFVAIGKVDKAISVVMELAREQRKGGRKNKETAARVLRKALAWNPENADEIGKIAAEIETEVAALPPEPEPGETKPKEEGMDLDVDVVEDEAASADLDIDVDIDEDDDNHEEASKREVEEVPSRPFAPVDANVALSVVEDGEEGVGDVEKVVLEARVYVKYKMFEHALGHLDAVFVRDANHVAALELQAQILMELGRNVDAADSFVRLAQLVSSNDLRQARAHLEQAQKLVPDHTKADMVLAALDSGDIGGGGETTPLVSGMQSSLHGDPASEPADKSSEAAELIAPESTPESDEPANSRDADPDDAASAQKPDSDAPGASEPEPRDTPDAPTPAVASEPAIAIETAAETREPALADDEPATADTNEPTAAQPEPASATETESASAATSVSEVEGATAVIESASVVTPATESVGAPSEIEPASAETPTEPTGPTDVASAETPTGPTEVASAETPADVASTVTPPATGPTEGSAARRLSELSVTETSGARKLPTERTSLPVSPLIKTFGEKTPLPSRFGDAASLPTFKPPPPEKASRGEPTSEPVAATDTPDAAPTAEENIPVIRPRPGMRGRKPPNPALPPVSSIPPVPSSAPPDQRPHEIEELDAGVIEELDADEVAEMVEMIEDAPSQPAPPRKGPPSRPKPPARRPPPPPPSSEDSKVQPVPEASKAELAPEDSAPPPVLEDSKAELAPEDSKTDAAPEVGAPQPVLEDSKTDAAPEVSAPQPVPEDSKIAAAPEVSAPQPVPEDSKTDAAPEVSAPQPVPEDSKIDAAPETSAPQPVLEDSKTDATPEASALQPVLEDSKTDAAPEVSAPQHVPEDSKADAAPEDLEPDVTVVDGEVRIAVEVSSAGDQPETAEPLPTVAVDPPATEQADSTTDAPAATDARTDAPAATEPASADQSDAAEVATEPARDVGASEPGPGDPTILAIDPVLAPEPTWPEITDEIQELRFFISGRFEDDAQFAYLDLQRRFPGHPALVEFADRLATGAKIESAAAPVMLDDPRPASVPSRGAAPARVAVLDDEDDEDTFLASIFDEPVTRVPGKSKPRRAVASLDDGADPQTFFDLGTAYREMGLVEDALAQFDLAAKDPRWTARARIMSASLRVQRREHDQAIDDLNLAIDFATDVDQRSEAGYELGVLYQNLGDKEQAIEALSAVAAGYRDRDGRLKTLGD